MTATVMEARRAAPAPAPAAAAARVHFDELWTFFAVLFSQGSVLASDLDNRDNSRGRKI